MNKVIPKRATTNLRWVIICLFAPILEEIFTKGCLMGFVFWLNKKNRHSELLIWSAIIIQAIFFLLLHFLSYSAGWYQAPSWLGEAGALVNLSAVQASLISAFIFALVGGFITTRDGLRNLAIVITAHYIVNQLLFVSFSVAFGV